MKNLNRKKSHAKNNQRHRKRKAELVAPQCPANCQVNHTIEQTAALLQCSTDTVRNMIEGGALPHIECGLGLSKKSKRVPHAALRKLIIGV